MYIVLFAGLTRQENLCTSTVIDVDVYCYYTHAFNSHITLLDGYWCHAEVKPSVELGEP